MGCSEWVAFGVLIAGLGFAWVQIISDVFFKEDSNNKIINERGDGD